MITASAGWVNGREPDLRIGMKLPELASALQGGIDASGMGKATGRLRRAFGTLRNYRVVKDAAGNFESVSININLPHAQIQDRGGPVPERRSKPGGPAMHWMSGGEGVFRRRAKGFNLPGFKYLDKGMAIFSARIGSIMTAEWE